MKIAVVGAGAMGCLFAGYLSRSGEEVWALDVRPEVVAAISSRGIRIREGEEEEWSIPMAATLAPQDIGSVDLVLFLVKSPRTREAAEKARVLRGEETVSLTLQNGLGNAEIIAEILGGSPVLGGVTNHGCTLLEPGSIFHRGRGETVIGEMGGESGGQRARKVAEVFSRAGLPTRVSPRIADEIWGKLLVNVGINALSAILRVPNGVLREHRECRGILREAVIEGQRVAEALAIRLPYGNGLEKTEEVCGATAMNFSSMLQDILQGRETEIDFINGAVVREGKKLGIETPVNRLLTALVKGLEETHSQRVK